MYRVGKDADIRAIDVESGGSLITVMRPLFNLCSAPSLFLDESGGDECRIFSACRELKKKYPFYLFVLYVYFGSTFIYLLIPKMKEIDQGK